MKLKNSQRKIGFVIPLLLILLGIILHGCDGSAIPGNGCGNSDDSDDNGPIVPEPEVDGGSRQAVVADWLNKSLSIIDLNALKPGASYNDILINRIDLSQYTPGPIDVTVTKDGKLALVSISAGWFATPGANAIIGENVPTGQSTLLFVDLAKRAVVGELNTGNDPMSIVLNGDGSKAFVAHFGSNYVAVVDIQQRAVVERIRVGNYSEEIAHDDTNTVGIVGYSASGNIRTYAVANPSDSLSRAVNLTGDAAGAAFFPKTKIAYMVQSATPLNSMRGGYTLVDVSNPESPKVLADERAYGMISTYSVVAASNRGTVLVPVVQNDLAALREYRLIGQTVSLNASIDNICSTQTFGALGIAYDAYTGNALMAMPRAKVLAVANLETKASFTIAWPGSKAGPAEIALVP